MTKARCLKGEFPTEGTDLQFTSEPGFGSEVDEELGIIPDNEVVYNVLSELLVWDGGSISSAPDGTQIRIANRGIGVPDTVITGSSGPPSREASPPRSTTASAVRMTRVTFHSDLDWFLEPNPGSPATGAYAVKLTLSTDEPGIADSDPFFIVHNFGLSETAFEEGVEAFRQPGPRTRVVDDRCRCDLRHGARETEACRASHTVGGRLF